MMRAPRLILAAGVMVMLSGCTYLDTMTGQTNNKVLPGQREDAIPGRTSFPEKADPTVGQASQTGSGATTASGCTANDPACKPPSTTNDTFKDPQ